jgi:hypothetical protein
MGLQVEHIFKGSFLTPSHIIDMCYPGFLLRILWSSQSGYHSQNNLVKLGYILDMKTKESFYILASLLELIHKNLMIWKKNPFKIWQIWGIFFPWEILCIGWNHIMKKNTVAGPLLAFHKPLPMSLIQYFFLPSRNLFSVNKSMLNLKIYWYWYYMCMYNCSQGLSN